MWNKNNIKLIYSNATRGSLSEEMLNDQYSRPNNNPIYKRFSEGKEKKELFAISIDRHLTNTLNIQCAYTYINWKNAGNIYNPLENNLLIINNNEIIKHSIGISMYYHF